MNNSILITGVGGFIGSNLAKYFYSKKYKVYGIDIIQTENISVNLSAYHQINLVNSTLTDLLNRYKPSCIFHCAGRASVNESMVKPDDDFNTNVIITQNVLDAIRNTGVETKFVYFSSAAVYGNPAKLPIHETTNLQPVSPYGFHKLIGELLCHEYTQIYKIPTAVIRIFSAYGTGLRRQVIWDIIKKVLQSDSVELFGNGNETRDFIHIKDLCKAIELLLLYGTFDASPYNFANGKEISIKDLAEIIIETMGTNNTVKFTNKANEGNPNNWVADIGKLKALGYQQEIEIQNGITQLALWAKSEIQSI